LLQQLIIQHFVKQKSREEKVLQTKLSHKLKHVHWELQLKILNNKQHRNNVSEKLPCKALYFHLLAVIIVMLNIVCAGHCKCENYPVVKQNCTSLTSTTKHRPFTIDCKH